MNIRLFPVYQESDVLLLWWPRVAPSALIALAAVLIRCASMLPARPQPGSRLRYWSIEVDFGHEPVDRCLLHRRTSAVVPSDHRSSQPVSVAVTWTNFPSRSR